MLQSSSFRCETYGSSFFSRYCGFRHVGIGLLWYLLRVNEAVSEKIWIQQAKKEAHMREVLSKRCLVGHWG